MRISPPREPGFRVFLSVWNPSFVWNRSPDAAAARGELAVTELCVRGHPCVRNMPSGCCHILSTVVQINICAVISCRAADLPSRIHSFEWVRSYGSVHPDHFLQLFFRHKYDKFLILKFSSCENLCSYGDTPAESAASGV